MVVVVVERQSRMVVSGKFELRLPVSSLSGGGTGNGPLWSAVSLLMCDVALLTSISPLIRDGELAMRNPR